MKLKESKNYICQNCNTGESMHSVFITETITSFDKEELDVGYKHISVCYNCDEIHINQEE